MIGSKFLFPLICLSLLSVLWFIGCGEDKDEVVDNPLPPNPPIQTPYAEDSVIHYPESGYARVYQMNVSAGKGSINVTISGENANVEDEVVIQAIIFHSDILLTPIAQNRALKGHTLMTPYKKSVRIDGLKKRAYRISLIGADVRWEPRWITETVEVK